MNHCLRTGRVSLSQYYSTPAPVLLQYSLFYWDILSSGLVWVAACQRLSGKIFKGYNRQSEDPEHFSLRYAPATSGGRTSIKMASLRVHIYGQTMMRGTPHRIICTDKITDECHNLGLRFPITRFYSLSLALAFFLSSFFLSLEPYFFV